jgi:hypothetical protein
MKIIKRSEIKDSEYREIFKKESHHNHEIIETRDGCLRWKANPDIEVFLKNISLNDLCSLLNCLGYDKNSEPYRKLYRDMGYSLSGYYDVFYWDANNEFSDDYISPVDEKIKTVQLYLIGFVIGVVIASIAIGIVN